jgi:transcriptional regulator with XRE-family HTH domain
MKNTRDLFRERLRQIIEKRGLKLEKVAELAGISLSFLNQLLSGKSAYSPETIDGLCEALECTQADFFGPSDAKSNADLILEIQSVLTALNEEQLRSVLALATAHSRGTVNRSDSEAL